MRVPEAGWQRGRQPLAIARPEESQMQRAVDARHPCMAAEARPRPEQRVDHGHVVRVAGGRLDERTPVTAEAKGIATQASGVARELDVDAIVVEHPDPEVPELADTGEAAADPQGSTRQFVDWPVGEVAGPDALQASIANRSGNPSIGPSALQELLPGHVHRRSLALEPAADGRRRATVDERAHSTFRRNGRFG